MLFHIVNNNWTMEIFIPMFYIYQKRNIISECIHMDFNFTVQSQFKNLCPKSHKIVFFIKKIYHNNKIDTGKQKRCSTVPAGGNLDLNRCTCNDKTLSANWQAEDTVYVPIELYSFELKSCYYPGSEQKMRWCVDVQADLRLFVHIWKKIGFLMIWPIFR